MTSFRTYVEQRDQKTLVLMRGVSGSGKSTKARKIQAERGGVIYSTDDFFVNPETGQYEFDPSQLRDNHAKNQQRTEEAMKSGITPIIIDNTNVKKWEMSAYEKLADQYGYRKEYIQPGSSEDFPKADLETLKARLKQREEEIGKAVPEDAVLRQLANFEE